LVVFLGSYFFLVSEPYKYNTSEEITGLDLKLEIK